MNIATYDWGGKDFVADHQLEIFISVLTNEDRVEPIARRLSKDGVVTFTSNSGDCVTIKRSTAMENDGV